MLSLLSIWKKRATCHVGKNSTTILTAQRFGTHVSPLPCQTKIQMKTISANMPNPSYWKIVHLSGKYGAWSQEPCSHAAGSQKGFQSLETPYLLRAHVGQHQAGGIGTAGRRHDQLQEKYRHSQAHHSRAGGITRARFGLSLSRNRAFQCGAFHLCKGYDQGTLPASH